MKTSEAITQSDHVIGQCIYVKFVEAKRCVYQIKWLVDAVAKLQR